MLFYLQFSLQTMLLKYKLKNLLQKINVNNKKTLSFIIFADPLKIDAAGNAVANVFGWKN